MINHQCSFWREPHLGFSEPVEVTDLAWREIKWMSCPLNIMTASHCEWHGNAAHTQWQATHLLGRRQISPQTADWQLHCSHWRSWVGLNFRTSSWTCQQLLQPDCECIGGPLGNETWRAVFLFPWPSLANLPSRYSLPVSFLLPFSCGLPPGGHSCLGGCHAPPQPPQASLQTAARSADLQLPSSARTHCCNSGPFPPKKNPH